MNMKESRESFGSGNSVRLMRSAVLALVLAASAVGCGGDGRLDRGRVDAGVDSSVVDEERRKLYEKCIRIAVKRSQMKKGENDEDPGWSFRGCVR